MTKFNQVNLVADFIASYAIASGAPGGFNVINLAMSDCSDPSWTREDIDQMSLRVEKRIDHPSFLASMYKRLMRDYHPKLY